MSVTIIVCDFCGHGERLTVSVRIDAQGRDCCVLLPPPGWGDSVSANDRKFDVCAEPSVRGRVGVRDEHDRGR